MILNESNIGQLIFEINNFIEKSKSRNDNKLRLEYLSVEHLKHHFKSGNIRNLKNLHKYFKCIYENPDKLKTIGKWEQYQQHNEIETLEINGKDRFSFIRKGKYIFVMSLLEHPRDFNYYENEDLSREVGFTFIKNLKDLQNQFEQLKDDFNKFIEGGHKDGKLENGNSFYAVLEEKTNTETKIILKIRFSNQPPGNKIKNDLKNTKYYFIDLSGDSSLKEIINVLGHNVMVYLDLNDLFDNMRNIRNVKDIINLFKTTSKGLFTKHPLGKIVINHGDIIIKLINGNNPIRIYSEVGKKGE